MLYVCPTPIGNLGDITRRAVEVLSAVDQVVCEDTRHTSILLRHLGLRKPLLSFFEHNEARRLDAVLGLLEQGKTLALVSDAGMPGLSDPGYTLVSACLERGLPVTVLPGASSVTVALVASGLSTDRFTFAGFLPRGSAAKVVAFLESAGAAGGTVVAFESPRRLRASLAAVAAHWPGRELAVCRELTKVHEEVLRGTAGAVLDRLADPVRGEIVLVLAPEAGSAAGGAPAAGGAGASRATLEEALTALVGQGFSTKAAAALVARLTGRPQRELYSLALELKKRL